MAIPEPKPGLVFRYEYVWKNQSLAGRSEGVKDRPCCIVLAVRRDIDDLHVLIVPVTRQTPKPMTPALEIPHRVKRHLGLDDFRSWIILSEANIDVWPSPAMRQLPNRPGEFQYGLLPERMVNMIREAIVRMLTKKALDLAHRPTPARRPRRR